jgi:hypothetical protein
MNPGDAIFIVSPRGMAGSALVHLLRERGFTKPEGTPRKGLDVSRFTKLGWKSRIRLEDGLRSKYAWELLQSGK